MSHKAGLRLVLVLCIPTLTWVAARDAGLLDRPESAAPRIERARPEPVKEDLVEFDAKVTAYCPCSRCCGAHADGRTAWWGGTNRGFADRPGVAVDPRAIPYGTDVWIPGVGWREADDTGGAMRRSWEAGHVHIDVRFQDHDEARRWGVRTMRVRMKRT